MSDRTRISRTTQEQETILRNHILNRLEQMTIPQQKYSVLAFCRLIHHPKPISLSDFKEMVRRQSKISASRYRRRHGLPPFFYQDLVSFYHMITDQDITDTSMSLFQEPYILSHVSSFLPYDPSIRQLSRTTYHFMTPDNILRNTPELSFDSQNITQSQFRYLIEKLPLMQSLRVLNLTNAKLRDYPNECRAFLQLLHESTRFLPHLRELYLGNNELELVGIQLPPQLRVLDLSHNIVSKDFERLCVHSISQMSHLRVLDLSYNLLHDRDCEILSEQFPHLPSLQSLNISSNFISSGHRAIALRIHHLRSLTELRCNRTQMTRRCVNELCQQIRAHHCPQLQVLELARCDIGNSSFRSILSIRKELSHLRVLNLSKNRITEIDSFLRILPRFRYMTHCDLSENRIQTFSVPLFIRGIEQIPGLIEIRISRNPLSLPIYNQVAHYYMNMDNDILLIHY